MRRLRHNWLPGIHTFMSHQSARPALRLACSMRVDMCPLTCCGRARRVPLQVRGDALMFYSLKPDGGMDETSLHGSCPTLAGDKWSATKWIHVGAFS